MPDIMEWLAAGIPITLLIDLLDPAGPRAERRYAEEHGDLGWIAAA
jgi:hypothetical protein